MKMRQRIGVVMLAGLGLGALVGNWLVGFTTLGCTPGLILAVVAQIAIVVLAGCLLANPGGGDQ